MIRIFSSKVVVYAVLSMLAVSAALYFFYTFKSGPDALTHCFTLSADRSIESDITCLEKTVERLFDTVMPADILAYANASTSPEAVMRECHLIGHFVGEVAYNKTRSVEQALSLCTSSCRSACPHGVIATAALSELGADAGVEDLAHADIRAVEEVAKRYCNRNELCHGIGHMVFAASDSFSDAIELCGRISDGIRREHCHRGVFMEGLGGNFSLVHSTPVPAEKDFAYPCNAVPEAAHHACFFYLPAYQESPFDSHGLNSSAKRLVKAKEVCDSFPGQSHTYCIEGIGSHAKRSFGATNNNTFCDAFTGSDRTACILGYVLRIATNFDYIPAINYCSQMRDTPPECFDALFQEI